MLRTTSQLFASLTTALCLSASFCFAGEADSPESKDLQAQSLGRAAVDASADDLKVWFHEAPSKLHDGKMPLKGLPLWHTNGESSDELIQETNAIG